MWETIYKSEVKLKGMALPQKNEGVTCHQYLIAIIRTPICYIFSVNNSDWHLRSISFELAKIQM